MRTTGGSSTCETAAGSCGAESASEVSDTAADTDGWSPAGTATTAAVRVLAASSTAGGRADCALAGCRGAASSRTTGAASGDVVGVRDSTGSSGCTVHGAGGGCSSAADTTVADRDPTQAGEGVVAVSGPVSVSHASAQVQCTGDAGACGGRSVAETSARDTAVSPHTRGTRAAADCAVTGGGCAGQAASAASSAPDFVVVDPVTGRPLPGQPASGPSSMSSSSAGLHCATPQCSGTVHTSTAAWDGAVNGGTPRTSTGTASCAGGTGGCEVRSVSTASTGSGAALALAPQSQTGRTQTQTGQSTQTGQAGETGQAQETGINKARLTPGPSAASAAGAALTCEGETRCDGKVSSKATGTDPTVSPDPRGSWSEGTCDGVTGGVCQAVTNSGASTGPDANIIAPLVAARSTANATLTEGTTGPTDDGSGQQQGQPGPDQPAVPPAPTAPGSSANTGGPTVPGASSWTMASATLDCAGGATCFGTTGTSARGSDGPATMNGANGARGPPAGGSSTSASCLTGQEACRAQTESSAGAGQVVADIIAEQQHGTAAQLAAEAQQAQQDAAQAARIARRAGATDEQKQAAADVAKAARQARTAAREAAELAARPVTDAPAALAQSSTAARCAGPDCAARTTGATTGPVSDTATSRTEATCVAADGGCAVTGDATATLVRNAGQTQGENPAPIPGVTGGGQTGSTITCPEAGCVGIVTGTVDATAGQDGRGSRSRATGTTGCDGTIACQAQITRRLHRHGHRAGGRPGQPVRHHLRPGRRGLRQRQPDRLRHPHLVHHHGGGREGRARHVDRDLRGGWCLPGGHRRFAAEGVVEATADCAGTGCRTHTKGTAQAAAPGGINKAASRTDCTAGTHGRCAGVSRVGATAEGAQASADVPGQRGLDLPARRLVGQLGTQPDRRQPRRGGRALRGRGRRRQRVVRDQRGRRDQRPSTPWLRPPARAVTALSAGTPTRRPARRRARRRPPGHGQR